MENKVETVEAKEPHLVTLTKNYYEESKQAKQERMLKNALNFDCYHLRQDYSHKIQGQSREVLPKQAMAVEQIVTFIQQGLADLGDWFTVEKNPGNPKPLLSEDEVRLLVQYALDRCDFLSFIGDSVKLGLLQSLMIAKPHGEIYNRSVFYAEQKETTQTDNPENKKFDYALKKKDIPSWRPKLDLIRAEDWYPDPKKENGLYNIQEIYMDISDVFKMSEGPHPLYDKKAVDELHGSMVEADLQQLRKSRESGQNVSYNTGYRKQIKIWECWGTIIDETGKIIQENASWTIANDSFIIKQPKDNPFWHGDRPYVTSPFIRVPNSVWHKALMDAPTMNNIAINELYNLMIDDGMNSVHGIKQIRPDWLEDESQVTNGIGPGVTLKVNSNAPTGGKVLERVDTSQMSPETLNMFHVMNSEFSASALTNDLRMGVLPNRSVKATEVVEASQSITSVFTGISKTIEEKYIVKVLMMLFKLELQHLDKIYRKDLNDLFGQERTDTILAIPKAVLFSDLVDGFTFKVYGVSRILSKQKDFKKFTALLQTIASDPVIGEEFQKEYSMAKFLGEILRSLDIPVDRIKLSDEEKAQEAAAMQQSQGASQPGSAPDAQSQIPQADSQESANSVESNIPRTDFGGLENKAKGGMA